MLAFHRSRFADLLDAVASPASVSKVQITYGLVRISAEMVGILLDSCFPGELQNLSLKFVSKVGQRELERATALPIQRC